MLSPRISTDHLSLRIINSSDTDQIYHIFSDADVCRYWSAEVMTDKKEAEQFIETVHRGMEDGSLLEWGITLRGKSELIGTGAYSAWNKKHRTAEIGFALRRDVWGKGYMKEFLGPFLNWGFEELDLHRIQADVDPRNLASLSLLEYYGFRKEGMLRECYRLNNEIQDAVILGLLRPDFKY
ncbi:GNAT family N-acetyltransferase [Balneola sp. MJW-20]|uniref:GNAT family N-acetyltransferase n=1 Tax=Gracilimonas aurantiaca TaxID=3234185 RepID=UPI0034665F84